MAKQKIVVKGSEIQYFSKSNKDYISLTDIARYKNPREPKDIIKNWIRTKSTIEFIGLWEKLNNPNFKGVEFDSFKNESGGNSFVLSPQKWIDSTNAIGIISKSGRYNSGTFAHKDIAFEFASWISPEFKLYLIKEFQRLKDEENERLALGWDIRRTLTKINYRIHTDAIKEHLIPTLVTQDENIVYASEADILNKALFNLTAKEWREKNPKKEGNIRDYSTLEQLVILANLETLNAEFIRQGLSQGKRLIELNKIAIIQMRTLLVCPAMNQIKKQA